MVSMATLMLFMYKYGLSNEAVKAWSASNHAAAADCYGAADASYPLARQYLKSATLLGVAAVAHRETGWQTPSPLDQSGNHAGMQGFAMRRARYPEDYAGDVTYFDYSFEGRSPGVDLGDGLSEYNFELAYWLVMHVLPLAITNYCDQRGTHSAYSQFENWSTAEFLVRSQIYTCEEAIKMMEVTVVEPWKTNAGTYTGKPLLFVNAFSVGQGPRIQAMVAYLPEDNDPNTIRAALKVMAEVYVRSGLAPKGMAACQVYGTMANLSGLMGGSCAVKNITLGSSASQGICECYEQLVTGGGDIITTITRDGGRQTVKVRIVPADKAEICRLWNEPGARAAADAVALSRFAAKHYPAGVAPSWAGGVAIVEIEDEDESGGDDAEVEDEGEGESSSESGGDDAPETVEARPPSEELTPALLSAIFYSVSLYAEALKSGEVEAVLTAVGERVDALGPAEVRTLHLELERARGARGGRRTGGRANLSRIWGAVSRPSWHPGSEGFLERARAARAGLVEPVPREVPELLDDDGVLIFDASSGETGFQKLWDQYLADEAAGRARSTLQKTQKQLFGSLEAMYPRDAEYSDGAGLASVVVGDRVDALYEDGRRSKVWCAATVVSFDETTFTVHFDDGDDATLSFQMIRKRVPAPDVEFAAGDHVHADWKGHGKYYGATVRARRGDGTYNLEYDIVDGVIDYEGGVHADRVWP